MYPILGYVDRWSVKPGGKIKAMISSAGDQPFEARIARVLCGDPNPQGPGYREIAMPHPVQGSHPGKDQPAIPGSWAVAPSVDPSAGAGGVSLAVTIWPTTPQKGPQGLIAWTGAGGARLSLSIDRDAVVATASWAGGEARVVHPGVLLERCWYDVWAAFDPKRGALRVGRRPREIHPGSADFGEASGALAGFPALGVGAVTMAASPTGDGSGRPNQHFNGKLERPTIWTGARSADELVSAQIAPLVSSAPGMIACWDFSIGISTLSITDVGPSASHGRVENLPTRAMTGVAWTGEHHRWLEAPSQWGAIHFHDDDLGDLAWTPSLEIEIPSDWPSGLYALHLKSAAGFDNVPFIVRPADGAAKAKVALLLPTVSYHVYSQFVRDGFGDQNRARAKAWGAIEHQPDDNPELGRSPYNFHSDGSGVAHATMARPMVDKRVNHFVMMDPAEYASGCYWICVDSYVIDWLTRAGIEHDIITDHDMHAEGAALLNDYAVVLTGQHPEYHTTEMLDALEGYLGQGGRFIYMGGNGFYWKTVFHPEAPYALEVRRAEGGIRMWATEPGENYHAFDGSYGGLWRRLGRTAYKLVGVGFSSQGIYLGFPYTVSPGILNPRVGFLRTDLESVLKPGAIMGERGFMGGGASGHELDRADPKMGTPVHALVVASSVVDHPGYEPVNEDRLNQLWPGTTADLIRSDITFFETASGGAVLSVGSMNFVGALPVDGYQNTLARMMLNAVKRFADPEPFKI